MSKVIVRAYGKINLSLEVLGKRTDGFHEIRSVMQSISLFDEVILEPADEISLECDLCHLAGPDNLAMRAATVLQQAAGREMGAHIELNKGIPEAAGLGGASADAAAALVGLNHLWGLNFSLQRLEQLAADIGSDVPFFLSGGTALVRGRGELVDRLPDIVPTFWLVLLIPPHTLSTKTATLYRMLKPGNWSSGERTEKLVEAIIHGAQVPEELMGNTFEDVADSIFPDLATYREAMLRAGADRVHLSGAGPAIFSRFLSQTAAKSTSDNLASWGFHPLMAHTLTAGESRLQPEQYSGK